jgi:DNA-binding NtrC family response regulator
MGKILFVDDDPNLLAGLRRRFRKEFDIECAEGAGAALALLEADDGVAVVVSDMRMPGIDGIDFLAIVARRFPSLMRIMLTGNVDLATSTDALRRGKVFRFLQKPCPMDEMAATLRLALETSAGANGRALVPAD